MKNRPLVAILVATFNGEAYLKEQLDSLLIQSYKNIKIYISDDNSCDTTLEIVKLYQIKYPDKIFYSFNINNLGFIKNFEKLLSVCEEEYIALSDQDDIWHPDKLQKQMRAMHKLEELHENLPLLVHSDLEVVDESLKKISSSYFRLRAYKLKAQKDLGHIVGPSGIMGNTILMNQKLKKCVLPFPKELDVHDYWIGLQCELFGRRKTLFEPLVRYRIHQTNNSNSQTKLYEKKSFLNILSRDRKLPNLETNRKLFLQELILQVNNGEDLKVLNAYNRYLNFQGSRLALYFDLLKYSLVKRDLTFRVKLFFKILYTNRYQESTKE